MSAGHEYVGGSGIVSSAADVLGMNVVCGMRGVGFGVCESGLFVVDGWSRYLCIVLGGYLLHLIDICFLLCIYLRQISLI